MMPARTGFHVSAIAEALADLAEALAEAGRFGFWIRD
jgi:hypothetical protein